MTNLEANNDDIIYVQSVRDRVKESEAFRRFIDSLAEREAHRFISANSAVTLKPMTRQCARLKSDIISNGGTGRIVSLNLDDAPPSRLLALSVTFVALVAVLAAVVIWPQVAPDARASTIPQDETKVSAVPEPKGTSIEGVASHGGGYGLTEDAFISFTAGTDISKCYTSLIGYSRPALAVAIARQETGLGTNIRSGANNVGNIKSHKPGRTWKAYPDKCQALEDVAILLDTDAYRPLTDVDQVRARYCGGDAEGCGTWTRNVSAFLAELES